MEQTYSIFMERDTYFLLLFFLFQVVLNTGGDQYQTVTIVPSDGNTGEVYKNVFLKFNLFSNVFSRSLRKMINFALFYKICIITCLDFFCLIKF